MTHVKNKNILYYIGRVLVYALLLGIVWLALIPFFWMLLSSLKLNGEVFNIPMKWFPAVFRWENYREIFVRVPLLMYIKNTAKLTVIITFLQLLTSSFAAYAFAKIDFVGRDILFIAYVGTIAVPWQVYMIPQFIMMRTFGLTNTHTAIIILQAFSAFGVFLIRQFYVTVPNELSEAARIDGLSEYGIYARIMLPLSKPSLATLTIFTSVAVWNDFMGPMIYFNDRNLKTLQLGIRMFIQQYSADYAYIMAASIVSLIPVAVVFLFMQRFFIEGIATSGLKG